MDKTYAIVTAALYLGLALGWVLCFFLQARKKETFNAKLIELRDNYELVLQQLYVVETDGATKETRPTFREWYGLWHDRAQAVKKDNEG